MYTYDILCYETLGPKEGDRTMTVKGMSGHLIRRLHQLSTQVFTQTMQNAGLDLTPVQFAAMDTIAALPGIDQASVALHIAYDKATIGGVIDRLIQKGYVSRDVSKTDRRAREVRLTDLGSRVYNRAYPVVTALQDDILARLDDQERRSFVALMTKAIGAEDALN